MTTLRAFFAVEVGAPLRAWYAGVHAKLAEKYDAVRWIPPENLHLTLRFLGSVETGRVPDLLRALEGAVSGMAGAPGEAPSREPASGGNRPRPLRLALDRPGSYGSARSPRVYWIGLRGVEALAALERIARELDTRLERLGFAPESRPWSAHLTVGRPRRRAGAPGWEGLVERALDHAQDLLVETAALLESRLDRGGARYSVLGSVSIPEAMRARDDE